MTFRSVLPLLVLLLGCAPSDEDSDDDGNGVVANVSTDECASGQKWVGGNRESSRMHPGLDCIGCHTQMDEGPSYAVAGTVFENVDEPDDCFGVADATIEVTDAEGSSWTVDTNEAGNFWIKSSDGPVVAPYSAKIIYDGMELAMLTPQSEGSCATCHTSDGANAATGRIFIP